MGGKTLVKNTLVFGIILLFIVSAVSPIVIGFNAVKSERDEFLDNLAFYYYDEYDSSKFEHYKEYFQRDISEIADLEEITIPVESPQTSVSSGPMDSPWPMKCHDSHHTSRSPYSTAHIDGLEIESHGEYNETMNDLPLDITLLFGIIDGFYITEENGWTFFIVNATSLYVVYMDKISEYRYSYDINYFTYPIFFGFWGYNLKTRGIWKDNFICGLIIADW